ncbi:MAG: glycine--tRNA ligase [Patescibacteria group bacterium]
MMEDIIALCKRRGFIYPSSEIYGGMAAVYDYGPYGVLLKNNIQDAWWKNMVQYRQDVIGLDSGIFMHPTTWKASGHVESFSDPQIDCRVCNNRIRADHMLKKYGYDFDRVSVEEINKTLSELSAKGKLHCDKCGSTDMTEARDFNLLVRTNFGSPVGALKDMKEEDVVYARGETCQGIYLNFKNILDSMRVKLPFGIAQVGKAFRNEIVARQFIFRTREFEQMELQYFVHPRDMAQKFDYWIEERMKWYFDVLCISKENLRLKKHDKLAHYAKSAYDIQYNFKSLNGFDEIEGVHQRGDWDLTRHSKFSGHELDYTDPTTKEKFVPHIMETSVGLNRLVFMVLDFAFKKEELSNGKSRVVLQLPPSIAPIKAAVFPLQKDEKLANAAKNIYTNLCKEFSVEYDDAGNIGKMYRRQDEIGTPFCLTIDYQSLEDNTITIRERDTMRQVRVATSESASYIKDKL